jgi:hypothetical protein
MQEKTKMIRPWPCDRSGALHPNNSSEYLLPLLDQRFVLVQQ